MKTFKLLPHSWQTAGWTIAGMGAGMMLWGFFMKLVVGDRAGIYVDTVFGN